MRQYKALVNACAWCMQIVLDEEPCVVYGMCVKTWIDYRLTWNSSEFGGLPHVYLSASDVWTPDATLYNKSDQHR